MQSTRNNPRGGPAAPPRTSPVRGRILWPALGFPAVVAPGGGRHSEFTLRDGDATKCICVLVLTDRKNLSKAEAARYLRCVPWADRARRHVAAGAEGSFREVDLVVRNDVTGPPLAFAGRKDDFGEHVVFGANGDGRNGIVASLAKRVRDFYRKQGLAYLHEIRVGAEATARLKDGRYNLFWNNESPGEVPPSDEMRMLLLRYASPVRATLGAAWRARTLFLLQEYDYEYGGIHEPYRSRGAVKTRAEILHPLFVERRLAGPVRIGHVTDTHVDVRADVYEHNLDAARARGEIPAGKGIINNFNRSFAKVYQDARASSDVLLLTGDLVDYGRGHIGIEQAGRLQDDGAYHQDRNWFLFYYLLASRDLYQRPVYTILGNHDWRLNPYPPFAPGAPSPNEVIHDHLQMKRDDPKRDIDQKRVIQAAHGPGHKRGYSYTTTAENAGQLLRRNTGDALKALVKLFGQTRNLVGRGYPTETSVESIAWYLFSINPFLDYHFTLPGRQSVLMLDWAKDEAVLLPRIANGKVGPYDPLSPGSAAGTPRPSKCLTPLQNRLVAEFVRGPSKAKIVGIHAPPIGPFGDWYDADLRGSRKSYAEPRKSRGPSSGHPLFAIRPRGAPHGMTPERGAPLKGRDEFIRTVMDPRYSVRAVFAGHIHRNGLYVVYPARQRIELATPKDIVKSVPIVGGLLVGGVVPQAVRGAPPPAVTADRRAGPLFVNTTSAGPRGSFEERPLTEAEKAWGGRTNEPGFARLLLASDGTIREVEFRASPSRPPRAAQPARRPARPRARQPELALPTW